MKYNSFNLCPSVHDKLTRQWERKFRAVEGFSEKTQLLIAARITEWAELRVYALSQQQHDSTDIICKRPIEIFCIEHCRVVNKDASLSAMQSKHTRSSQASIKTTHLLLYSISKLYSHTETFWWRRCSSHSHSLCSWASRVFQASARWPSCMQRSSSRWDHSARPPESAKSCPQRALSWLLCSAFHSQRSRCPHSHSRTCNALRWRRCCLRRTLCAARRGSASWRSRATQCTWEALCHATNYRVLYWMCMYS